MGLSRAMRIAYVDRLRGLAALMVVIAHGASCIPLALYQFPQHFRLSIVGNAYHGVSIFFAISGFLITTKILDASSPSGWFSVPRFYEHRVARIAPCLLLMVAAALWAATLGIERFEVDWKQIPTVLGCIFTFRFNVCVL